MEAPGTSDDREEIVNLTYHQDGLTINIGFDPDGPVGGKNFISVSGDDFYIKRHFFFDDSELKVMKGFADNVGEDENLREASIDGTATWKQVADIYTEAAARVESIFVEKGLMSHYAGNETQKRRHYHARDELKSLCQEIFDEVDAQVRSDDLIVGLNTFVEERLDEAERITNEIMQTEYSTDESEHGIETSRK